MKTVLLALSALAMLSGCIVEDLNSAVNASTYTIYSNQEAVNRSSERIRENCALVSESNAVLEENRRLLNSIK